MKKVFFIVLFYIMLIQPAFCAGIYKKLDFTNENSNPAANEILYNYILEKENMTPEEIENFANITPQSVKAFKEDLNDDGVNEIIGVVYSTYYMGTAGYSFFILQKQNNIYKDITYILNFEPLLSFYILNSKTNSYKNIKFYGAAAYNFKPFIAKYKNGLYQNAKQTRGLEKALCH